jgi:hypothetical protein
VINARKNGARLLVPGVNVIVQRPESTSDIAMGTSLSAKKILNNFSNLNL